MQEADNSHNAADGVDDNRDCLFECVSHCERGGGQRNRTRQRRLKDHGSPLRMKRNPMPAVSSDSF